MLHDLGLEKHQITDISAVQQKIDEIDKHFQLVMLAERFNFIFLSLYLRAKSYKIGFGDCPAALGNWP